MDDDKGEAESDNEVTDGLDAAAIRGAMHQCQMIDQLDASNGGGALHTPPEPNPARDNEYVVRADVTVLESSGRSAAHLAACRTPSRLTSIQFNCLYPHVYTYGSFAPIIEIRSIQISQIHSKMGAKREKSGAEKEEEEEDATPSLFATDSKFHIANYSHTQAAPELPKDVPKPSSSSRRDEKDGQDGPSNRKKKRRNRFLRYRKTYECDACGEYKSAESVAESAYHDGRYCLECLENGKCPTDPGFASKWEALAEFLPGY